MGIIWRSIFRMRREDRGSISILTLGLFGVLLLTSLLLIDISAAYLAKRSLTLALEAASQQGLKNLDRESYYRGELNINRFNLSVYGLGEEDPGIPIDCAAGKIDAERVLESWQERGTTVTSANLRDIEMTEFRCDGYQISLSARGSAELPIPIPFIDFSEVTFLSSVSSIGERASSNNYSGIDLG